MAGVALSPARKRLRRRERGLAYLLLIPSLLVFGVFVFWPLVHNVYLGFYRNPPFPGLPSTYVGFDQYRDVLSSQDFFDSVKITFLFAILTVPTGIVCGLGLAVLAHQKLRGLLDPDARASDVVTQLPTRSSGTVTRSASS